MMYDKLLLGITAIALVMVQAHADDFSAGDPLSPSFVGESMSTGMDLGLVQQAKDAGIITESNSLYKSVSSPSATYLGSTPAAGAGAQTANEPTANDPTATAVSEPSGQNVNVTGIWSLDLTGELTRHTNLNIIQNKDAIMGHGTMTGGNGTQKVTASGTLTGNRLSLTVMPVGSMDLYKLDLSLDSHIIGTYTAYSADGNMQSGDVTGTAPEGISAMTPDTITPDTIASNPNTTETAGAGAESAGAAGAGSPIRIGTANNAATSSSSINIGSGSASLSQGFSGSSSSSTSVSMVSSGGSSGMQSFSSMSGSM